MLTLRSKHAKIIQSNKEKDQDHMDVDESYDDDDLAEKIKRRLPGTVVQSGFQPRGISARSLADAYNVAAEANTCRQPSKWFV
jgi:hypothetical protein